MSEAGDPPFEDPEAAAQASADQRRLQDWRVRERAGSDPEAVFGPNEAALCRAFLLRMNAQNLPRAHQLQEAGVPTGEVFWQMPAFYLGYEVGEDSQPRNVFLCADGKLRTTGDDVDFGDFTVNQYRELFTDSASRDATPPTIGRHETWRTPSYSWRFVTDGSEQPDDLVTSREVDFVDPDSRQEWRGQIERRYRKADRMGSVARTLFVVMDLQIRLLELETGIPQEGHVSHGLKSDRDGTLLEVGGFPIIDGTIAERAGSAD
jgi:hypothetical protein